MKSSTLFGTVTVITGLCGPNRATDPERKRAIYLRKQHDMPAVTSGRFSIVVIAASAGGLAAIRTLLAPLPPDFPAAIAIVQHRSPSLPSKFEELLRSRTTLTVKSAEEGDLMQAGTV